MTTGDSLPRRRALLWLGAGFALPASAQAPSYPTKPVRVIVGFPPGAGVDIVTRLVAAKLSSQLEQQFFVDNRSGAAGNIAAAAVAHAPADGYTLLAAPSSFVGGQEVHANVNFDPDKDFAPVAMMATIPSMLVTRPGLQAASVKDLVALAKRKPDELTYASTGIGSSPHLITEEFMTQAGIKMRHIPYRGTPLAMNDLMAGQVDVMFANVASVLSLVNNRKVEALGIASTRRNPGLPQVPTLIEAGFANFEQGTWAALLAPRGTPAAIVARLNSAVQLAGRSQELRDLLREQGAEVREATPEQTAAWILEEGARRARVMKATNARSN